MKMLNEFKKCLKFAFEKAFKTLWVTNALDGSDGFLVSDKIMSPAGKSIRNFRNKSMNKPLPKTVNLLINSIIPPKRIKKGKRSDGSELCDAEEMDQGENVCDENDEEEDVDPELLL